MTKLDSSAIKEVIILIVLWIIIGAIASFATMGMVIAGATSMWFIPWVVHIIFLVLIIRWAWKNLL